MNTNTNIPHPNKSFVAEYSRNGVHVFIVVVAESEEVAIEHIREHFGITVEVTWLMNCDYTTLYDQKGEKPIKPQAKILYRKIIPVKFD